MPTPISHGYPGAMSKDVATRRLLQKEMRETMAFHATDRIAGVCRGCRLGVVEHIFLNSECKAELLFASLFGKGRISKWQHASCPDFDFLGKSNV